MAAKVNDFLVQFADAFVNTLIHAIDFIRFIETDEFLL